MAATEITLLIGATLFLLLLVAEAVKYGTLWFLAYMCGADVSVMSLIGMSSPGQAQHDRQGQVHW